MASLDGYIEGTHKKKPCKECDGLIKAWYVPASGKHAGESIKWPTLYCADCKKTADARKSLQSYHNMAAAPQPTGGATSASGGAGSTADGAAPSRPSCPVRESQLRQQ